MEIKRENLAQTLESFAFEGNGIVVGAPGAGKTFMLKALCNDLLEQKIPCLYLPIDTLAVDTEGALRGELGYTGDFISFLRREKGDSRQIGIIVVDAFDAARSETVQKFYMSLVRQIITELSGLWNVIVSVRTYDAKKSEDLLDLFPVSGEKTPPSDFQIAEVKCRHLFIPKLSDADIKLTVQTIANLPAIYEQASADLKELLRIPFNLWLIERLLSADPQIPELSTMSSEVQLLGLFWKRRVIDGSLGEDKKVLLSKVTQAMVEQRSLSVRTDQVYPIGSSTALNDLLSMEVLTNVSTTGQRVAFAHNILFDYAVSVLLIEDDADKLVEFVTKDPSRPLFLRPSLNYYFTRLWHTAPDLFWKSFWHTLPASDLPLRLFARLLPPTVIVTEARNLDELAPLLSLLHKNKHYASEGTLRVLEALRSLEVERDGLWAQFLDQASMQLHHDFAWSLALLASAMIDRAKKNRNAQVIQSCGSVSRRLLNWIWKQREQTKNSQIDSIGGRWGVRLAAKTFSTDPRATRLLLEKVLVLIEEAGFPILFVQSLSEELDNIWPYDPEFAGMVYFKVFGHFELSEEKTNFGSPVLPLTSTRRQDFDMCHYLLIQHFPNFLRAAPLHAAKATMQSLNIYILAKEVIPFLKDGVTWQSLVQKFQFRGKTATYLPDLSYSWDESHFPDEPIKLANQLFGFISELASTGNIDVIDQLLDIFRDHVAIAFFWRRVLLIGAQNPKLLSSKLFELCIAKPVQEYPETIHELGMFLEAAVSEFTDDQMISLEQSIIELPENEKDANRREALEHWRDRLLGRMPLDLLRTDVARGIRKHMEETGKIPPNEPLVQFGEVHSVPHTQDDWIKEQGVEPTRSENVAVTKFFGPLDKFEQEYQNSIPTIEAVISILPVARDLLDGLEQGSDADEPVLQLAWTKLGSCCKNSSRVTSDPETEISKFSRQVLLKCASHKYPLPDPKFDADYNFPHWSPSPRTEAAQGLPWLGARLADDDLLNAIDRLTHDPVPSIRFLVTHELFRISLTAPEVFWRLLGDIAENEPNKVVQQALCRSLYYVIAREESKAVTVLDKLVGRVLADTEDSDLSRDIVSLISWLTVSRNNAWAIKIVDTILAEPTRFPGSLSNFAFSTLDFLKPQNLELAEEQEESTRAILWLGKTIDSAAKGIKNLLAIPQPEWNDATRSKMHTIYGVIDSVIIRFSFASEVKKDQHNKDSQPVTEKQRASFYVHVKPLLEQILAFATDEKNGLMFAPTAHHFMELLNGMLKYDPVGVLHMAANIAKSSKPSGYNFDSLAIGDIVILVEAILADYRSEVREGESLQDLLTLLDVFVEAGWSDALRLVWRLDEVFR